MTAFTQDENMPRPEKDLAKEKLARKLVTAALPDLWPAVLLPSTLPEFGLFLLGI